MNFVNILILRLSKSSQIQPLIVPAILFLVLILSYLTYFKTLPVSAHDESLWVGRSCFFQFYIHGDFHNKVWRTYGSFDQPKLAEYAFGAFLYPLYLIEKRTEKKPFDYTRFLIKNGFCEPNRYIMTTYADYTKNHPAVTLDPKDNDLSAFNPKTEDIDNYKTNIVKPVRIIYYARILNVFLLTGAALLAYFLAAPHMGTILATIFTVFYGLNSLIMNVGLKAHSDALFLFTFNAAFLCMNHYFVESRKIFYLLLFSLFAALCMSTKLNGSILVIIFFTCNMVLSFNTETKIAQRILVGLLPAIISFAIFISLNPFTLSAPIEKTSYMFQHRAKEASIQAQNHKEAYLADKPSRIKRIFTNFYFSPKTSSYNGVSFIKKITKSKGYRGILVFLLILGLYHSLSLTLKKDIRNIIAICSFLTILALMSCYLVLDWHRYYVHTSFFFFLFQFLGLYFVLTNTGGYIKSYLQDKR